MAIEKVITNDDELYLYMNGNLIYKRWLKTGQSKVFDVMAYDKYTYMSLKDIDYRGNDLISVKAQINMMSTEEGGRSTAFRSGYRPNHVFKQEDNGKWIQSYMGYICFDDSEFIYPGETREVVVKFLSCLPIENYLNVGRSWYIYEGANLVGKGEILEFIN